MTDRAELIELCKIAQHLGGPQNLSAVGIGRYLRLCSPEVVLALFAEIEALRNQTIYWQCAPGIGLVRCVPDARYRKFSPSIRMRYSPVLMADSVMSKEG